MFPIEAFQQTLDKFTSILLRYKVRFHLTGGVTSVAYAEPRMTQDIDIVVDNAAFCQNLGPILEALAVSEFLFNEQSVRSAIANHKMFQLLDIAESLKLDIYPRELVDGELDRSGSVELFDGVFYPIASRNDTAVAKLFWVEQGSHKSRRDLRHLFFNASKKEQEEIIELATEFGKQVLLQNVLAETDEIDF